MQTQECVFLHSPELEQYHYPPESPLSTQRAGRTRAILASIGLLENDGRRELAPEPATRPDLESFHTRRYLEALKKGSEGVFDEDFLYLGLGTPDCPLFPGMYEYARLACGASLVGARLILSGQAKVAFNPSGGFHHAGPENASGFCYINDVALACLALAAAGKSVLYLDLDAHHADGVQNAFYRRNDVMTISLHQSGDTLFPGTGFEHEIGEGEGRGFSINLPLPVGTYDEAYLRAFREVVLPLAGAFDPQVLVLQLGMDGLSGDPLAHLHLTNNVFADIITSLLELDRPILATGGGGYNLENTARGWALAWAVLSGARTADELAAGLGGVMLQSTEWVGGLRDRALLSHGGQRKVVDQAIQASIQKIKKAIFPIHSVRA